MITWRTGGDLEISPVPLYVSTFFKLRDKRCFTSLETIASCDTPEKIATWPRALRRTLPADQQPQLFSTVTQITPYHLRWSWSPQEEVIARRWSLLILLFLLLVPLRFAKDKKEILPAYVLNALTVLVVIDPNTGISRPNPTENQTAQDNVEKAFMNCRIRTSIQLTRRSETIV